jgi:CRP/FNR family cyclic AMP-dependent transcriptional regulator
MPAVPDPKTLGAMPLFHGLTLEQLTWLNHHLHRTTFPAGSHLFTAEQPGDVVYIILSGTVKIHVEQEDGSDVIVAFRGPGDPIGEMSLLDRAGRSASVTTVEDATLVWMNRASFQECLQTMPALSYNLLQILARRLREATEQIQALAAQDVNGRVARLLLVFVQVRGQTTPGGSVLIPLRLTQSDIADCVGASRVHVNKILGTYKRRKYISVDPNYRITVHDQAALAQYCR